MAAAIVREHAEGRGEARDDEVFAALFGIGSSDAIGDEDACPKGNPGLEHGQPDILSLRRAW